MAGCAAERSGKNQAHAVLHRRARGTGRWCPAGVHAPAERSRRWSRPCPADHPGTRDVREALLQFGGLLNNAARADLGAFRDAAAQKRIGRQARIISTAPGLVPILEQMMPHALDFAIAVRVHYFPEEQHEFFVGVARSSAVVGIHRLLMQDVAKRVASRVQMTTDGHLAYLEAVEGAFGAAIDYAMLVKIYGTPEGAIGRYSPGECIGAEKRRVEGKPEPKHISTSYVERQNLNLRMGIRRFTRLTNAFSKSADAHYAMMCLYVVFHNFIRDHKTLRMTPAESIGLVKSAMTVGDIVDLIDARAEPPKKRGSYKERQPEVDKQPSI
jgi:hypothetical protein